MKKKLLMSLTCPEITDSELVRAGEEGLGYAMKVRKAECGDEAVHVITFRTFRPCITSDGFSFLSGRTFIWKDGWTTLIEGSDGTVKWSRKEPMDIFLLRGHDGDCCRAVLNDAAYCLASSGWNSFRDGIRLKERRARERKAVSDINSSMALFRKNLPAAYSRHSVQERPFEHFLIYSDEEKKGFCTACGRELALDARKTAHGSTGRCPACRAQVTYRSAKVGRKILNVPKWSFAVEKGRDGTLLFRYFRHSRDLSDWKRPVYRIHEIYRAVVSKRKTVLYEKVNYKDLGLTDGWGYPVRHCFSAWGSPSEWYEPYSFVHVQAESTLKRTVCGTRWQYSGFECYAVLSDGLPYYPHYYLRCWERKPCMEKLARCGFIRLAENQMECRPISLDVDAGGIRDILKLTGNEYGLISKNPAGATALQVEMLRNFRSQTGREMRPSEFGVFLKLDRKGYARQGNPVADMISLVRRGLTATKVYRYLTEQGACVHDYLDYIEELEQLEALYAEKGQDVHLMVPFNLYPAGFAESHERRSLELRKMKDEARSREIAEFDRRLSEAADTVRKELSEFGKGLRIKSLFVRPPERLSELDEEGACLHHCVATYKERVMNGDTEIFLIRKAESPDTPYFTMEWKDGRIIQVRGLRNCDPPPEVRALADAFAAFLKERKAPAAS